MNKRAKENAAKNTKKDQRIDLREEFLRLARFKGKLVSMQATVASI